MVQFCYLRPGADPHPLHPPPRSGPEDYMCGHWNCFRRLLIPMANMNIDWNWKTFQPVFPNYNAIPTTITKIIMVSYPDEFDGHLVHNYTAAFRVWRVKILNNNFSQEPITRSEQLTCPRVTAFSRTSLFLERFCREFWISFKILQTSQRNLQTQKLHFLPFSNV